MSSKEMWDWNTREKCLADFGVLKEEYSTIHEPLVSPDGEKFAVPVKNEDDEWTLVVNNEAWPNLFEKIWLPRFSPDGRLTALVMSDDMWNLAVDGESWEGEFDFAWNTKFSPDGSHIAVQTKIAGQFYSVIVDGEAWENKWLSMRDLVVDNNGNCAAIVQVSALKEADTVGFHEGTWGLACNDIVWDEKYISVYRPVISADGQHVAAEVRTGKHEYTIAQDGKAWPERYGCVWEPIYLLDGSVVAPVKVKGGWSLVKNGERVWKRTYSQVWNPKMSPDGKKVAATVSPVFGKWTISVDDLPWPVSFDEVVLEPHFSPDGAHVAAIVKTKGLWSICVDGSPWDVWFDMIWDPVFSDDGKMVVCKAEKGGKYTLVINGKVWDKDFDALWEPVFSPDGRDVLVKVMEGNSYYRRLVSVSEIG